MCNWFHFVNCARTFSNSVEAVLTIVAMYYWPWYNPNSGASAHIDIPPFPFGIFSGRQFSLMIASIAVVLRPTGAMVWLLLGIVHLLQISWNQKVKLFLFEVLPIGYIEHGSY